MFDALFVSNIHFVLIWTIPIQYARTICYARCLIQQYLLFPRSKLFCQGICQHIEFDSYTQYPCISQEFDFLHFRIDVFSHIFKMISNQLRHVTSFDQRAADILQGWVANCFYLLRTFQSLAHTQALPWPRESCNGNTSKWTPSADCFRPAQPIRRSCAFRADFGRLETRCFLWRSPKQRR